MSWISKISNSLKEAVTGKAVEIKVKSEIDKVNVDAIVALANVFGDGMSIVSVGLAQMLTSMLVENKNQIAKICGDNADSVIAIDKAVKQVIKDIKTEDNQILISGIKQQLVDIYNHFENDMDTQLVDTVSTPLQNLCADIGKPFGYEPDKKQYFIYYDDDEGNIITDTHHEVDKKRFDLRMVSLKLTRYGGKYYWRQSGNKVYETVPTKTTKEFYNDLGISDKGVDLINQSNMFPKTTEQ
jgi:hypothetical protein